MCAIVGVASIKPIFNKSWLSLACDSMIHRGPDDSGEWWSQDKCVGLAHRRLSIVELSASGHQPMRDLTRNTTLVFNGEIYNHNELRLQLVAKGHAFKSRSDSEVIIASWHEWGEDCVKHFNGMFSFAIYDERKQVVFLARDRAGEKPLFYSLNNNELRFSSELKGLMADKGFNKNINYTSLDCYLAMGYIPGDLCILDGVNKLPAGHTLLFDCKKGKHKLNAYWSPSYLDDSSPLMNEDDLLNELDVLIEDSVRLQLSADVPVGILLSGGVDSSLITAVAAKISKKVKTFTITFPDHKNYDESSHARLISDYFSTEHIELEANNIDSSLLPVLARQFDEPMCDSSMLPTFLVSQLVKEHCTVALGGDGGDELFGGYTHYSRLISSSKFLENMPMSLRNIVSKISETILPTGFRGRNWLQASNTNFNSGLPLIASLFDQKMRRSLLSNLHQLPKILPAEGIWIDKIPNIENLLQRATLMDFNNYLVEDILVKIDRTSMLNSLEMRSPLLDFRIIDFAFGKVPSDMKASSSERKILLKKLAQKKLPESFDFKRKQGFSIPLGEWLKKGSFRDLFYDVLTDSGSMFDIGSVNSILKGQDKGLRNTERLFSLVMFELWRREYNISV